MSFDRSASRVAVAAIVLDGVGAVVGRRQALVGEPFGMKLPRRVPLAAELAFWGSATSAPFVMDVIAFGLARRSAVDPRRARGLIALGLMRLVGVGCEPATWGRRHSRAAPTMAPCHLGIATAQIALGVTALRGGGQPPG